MKICKNLVDFLMMYAELTGKFEPLDLGDKKLLD